jgi:hypothetical protein
MPVILAAVKEHDSLLDATRNIYSRLKAVVLTLSPRSVLWAMGKGT